MKLYIAGVQIKLNSLEEVILGHTFRGAILEESSGNCYVLQAKNIKAEGDLSHEFTRINLEFSRAKGIVKDGDVILSNRGTFRAAVYRGNQKNIIAASSVYILRVKKHQILPEYLAIYLNSEVGQNALQNLNRGTLIKSLAKSDLLELSIPLPTPEKQKIIIAIQVNYIARKKLYAEKSELHQNIASYAINYLVTH